MLDYLQRLLGERGLAPHGFCLLWDPALIWTHVVADALIGTAYFSIPIAIAYFLTRRRDVAFGWVVWMFAAFIMACGATHFLSIWVLWHPDYGIEGLVKVATAAVSVFTAIALWPLLPRAIALPSPAQLQAVNGVLTERIAERDAALVALERATAERERAEARLREAQKLEAVGRLTGGIAHDFNNLMTIVMGNLDRAQRLPAGDPRKAAALSRAMAGTERAAKLTDQLLAFSGRQALQPEVADLRPQLARLPVDASAEQPSITVETAIDPQLWPVLVDGSETEKALANLVANARDAMPDGGTLTVRAVNCPDGSDDGPPGDHVLIEIADTGRGMDAATLEHAFEPFFTTKGLGQGNGLGLSQVHGFISQSRGRISIASRPGEGTTVRILLPRAPDSLREG